MQGDINVCAFGCSGGLQPPICSVDLRSTIRRLETAATTFVALQGFPGRSRMRGVFMDFQGRVAMVTGGSGALGSVVVNDLAANGVRVAVPYTSDQHWEALAAGAG